MAPSTSQLDDNGCCVLHPGIQIRTRTKAGEWRTLLNACPLCVSGLPATGQSAVRSIPSQVDEFHFESDNYLEPYEGEHDHHEPDFKHQDYEPDQPQLQQQQQYLESEYYAAPPPPPRPKSRSRDESREGRHSRERGTERGEKERSKKHHRKKREDGEKKSKKSSKKEKSKRRTPKKEREDSEGDVNNSDAIDYENNSLDGLTEVVPPPRRSSIEVQGELTPTQYFQQRQQQNNNRYPSPAPTQQQNRQQFSHQPQISNQLPNQQNHQQYQPIQPQKINHEFISKNEQLNTSSPQRPSHNGLNNIQRHASPAIHAPPASHFPRQKAQDMQQCRQTPPKRHPTQPPQQQQPIQNSENSHNGANNDGKIANSNINSEESPPRKPDPEAGESNYRAAIPRRPPPTNSSRYSSPINNMLPPPQHQQQPCNQPRMQSSQPMMQQQQFHQTLHRHQDLNQYRHEPIEQDDVSMMSMGSVVKKMYERNMNSDSFPDELDEEDDDHNENEEKEEDSGHEGDDGEEALRPSKAVQAQEINTAEFDSKGRCVRHPMVRLRRKKMFRGWQILLSNCPECCLDEMRRLKVNRPKSVGTSGTSSVISGSGTSKGGSSNGKGKSKSKGKISVVDPPLSQVEVENKKKKKKRRDGSSSSLSGNRSVGTEDDNKSIGTASTITISSYTTLPEGTMEIGTASTITISSYTHSTGGHHGHWSNFSGRGPKPGSPTSSLDGTGNPKNGPARVTRMPYTDQYGENGWYTGEVDANTGTPHGRGTMNYSNGAVYEGEWLNGVSATPSKTREEPLLGSNGSGSNGGGGSHRSRHNHHRGNGHYEHHNQKPPPRQQAPQGSRFEDGMSSVTPRQPHPPVPSQPAYPPQQQHHYHHHQPPPRKVVCGMPWTDVNGETGSYTGEVNSLNIPDGMGSMRYDNGVVAEGNWKDGEIDGDDGEDGNSDDAMSSGGDGLASTGMSFQGGYGGRSVGGTGVGGMGRVGFGVTSG
eukprot:CAMPEP_0171355230 /NCGR_PEP_ID=MMETSP0878-20121228/45113_1 /TAXON_ID=67004 /ORGANISM="Thalassiosira weissflogii, Strain CCMP1336" /LENGTH=983 /DNA_ID=CAMNT_0011861223 /DNA_START=26 /DNA_END=2975 /DNA_ORIENTATION=+